MALGVKRKTVGDKELWLNLLNHGRGNTRGKEGKHLKGALAWKIIGAETVDEWNGVLTGNRMEM